MIIKKKVSVEGDFAKKGEDINPGDIVTILDAGQITEGQYGEQFVIGVRTKNGDKVVTFNRTTQNILHDEFGADTDLWVGKDVIIRAKKTVIGGRKCEVYYFVTPAWVFDEYQELVRTGVETGVGPAPIMGSTNPVPMPSSIDPSPEDIPF